MRDEFTDNPIQSSEVTKAMAEVLPVRFDEIPLQLQILPQWLVWRYELDTRGVLKKPPINPKTGTYADVKNPETYGSFLDARAAYETGKYAGVGIVLTGSIIGIDFDKCVNRIVEEPYLTYLKRLNTYSELSPSGLGLRAFMFGKLPGTRRRNPPNDLKIELYDMRRYMTVTGWKIHTAPAEISSDQELINRFYYYLFPEPKGNPKRQVYHPRRDESIDAIIEKASNARNSNKFNALMSGNWESLGYKSKSEATFSFLLILAYWSSNDPVKMRLLYERSGMVDEKWWSRRGDATYGELTIENVLKKIR